MESFFEKNTTSYKQFYSRAGTLSVHRPILLRILVLVYDATVTRSRAMLRKYSPPSGHGISGSRRRSDGWRREEPRKNLLCRNPSHNTLSGITRVTPSLPRGGGNPRGLAPLTPGFNHFFDGPIRPCSTGRGSIDPERPWFHHHLIVSHTGFLQSKKILRVSPISRCR